MRSLLHDRLGCNVCNEGTPKPCVQRRFHEYLEAFLGVL